MKNPRGNEEPLLIVGYAAGVNYDRFFSVDLTPLGLVLVLVAYPRCPA